MSDIAISALDYYHDRLDSNKNVVFIDKMIDMMSILTIDGVEMKYNLLGKFIIEEKQFMWAWYMNGRGQKNNKTKLLMIYGLNMDSDTVSKAYVRRMITTNVHCGINEDVLTFIIALAAYFTKVDKLYQFEENGIIFYFGLYSI